MDETKYLNEINLLDEDLHSFISKLTKPVAEKFFKNLKAAIFRKDVAKIKSMVSKVPIIPTKKIKEAARKASPEFDTSYRLAKSHFKRLYPDVSDKVNELLSCLVGFTCSFKSKDVVKGTKDSLNKFDSFVKKNKSKFIKEQDFDITGLGVFVVIAAIIVFVGVKIVLWIGLWPLFAVGIIIAIIAGLVMIVVGSSG